MSTQQGFQWLPEHDLLLDKIASTDTIDPNTDWNNLRDVIKYKIDENTALFLSDQKLPTPPSPFQPLTSPSGGLKLPPFPPRKQQRPTYDIPVSYLTEGQANELKGYIFAQLDGFDSGPPFTIQRVCELCLHPRQHYNSVGKYLRAVEKSLLVTSTWDSFPPLSDVDYDPNGRSVFSLGSTRQSAPSTPLFSPIPFLHGDARRSKSRSPPPSPLALSSITTDHPEPLEPRALGLVDELDDPNPGHMSEHPTALSSVTTINDGAGPQRSLGSLEQRFVKGSEVTTEVETDKMVLDGEKENKS